MQKKIGFTLIELLVVIAIIAILAAILFPVFAKVRDKARQTACLSNLKQLGLAITQYTEDYDEVLPQISYGNNAFDTTQPHWCDVIYPYVKSTNVYNCPSDSLGDTNDTTDGAMVQPPSARNNSSDQYGSYAFNWSYQAGSSQGHPTHDPSGQTLAALQVPTDTVLLGETNHTTKIDAFYWDADWQNPVLSTSGGLTTLCSVGGYYCFAERHAGDFTNILWCDGHAKAVKLDYLAKKNSYNVMSAFTIEDDANS